MKRKKKVLLKLTDIENNSITWYDVFLKGFNSDYTKCQITRLKLAIKRVDNVIINIGNTMSNESYTEYIGKSGEPMFNGDSHVDIDLRIINNEAQIVSKEPIDSDIEWDIKVIKN